MRDETPIGPAHNMIIPLFAVATSARMLISTSPTRSVRPISVHVRGPDGTAWRVISLTVLASTRWYGDPPYPACPGYRWIDLEVECPHDQPPTEANPTELRGVIVCEASDLPISSADTERDRQWALDFRKPRGARRLANDEWEMVYRADSSPVHPVDPQNSTFVTEVRCRACDGLMQKTVGHTDDCSNCFGTFAHTQPIMRPCDFASHDSGHGSVIYIPRLVAHR